MRKIGLVIAVLSLGLAACATPGVGPPIPTPSETAIEIPANAIAESVLAGEFEKARAEVVNAAAPTVGELNDLRGKATRAYTVTLAARAVYDATIGANNSPALVEVLGRLRAVTDDSYRALIDEIDRRMASG